MLRATITRAAGSFSRLTAFPQEMSVLHSLDKRLPTAIFTMRCAIMHYLSTIDKKC